MVGEHVGFHGRFFTPVLPDPWTQDSDARQQPRELALRAPESHTPSRYRLQGCTWTLAVAGRLFWRTRTSAGPNCKLIVLLGHASIIFCPLREYFESVIRFLYFLLRFNRKHCTIWTNRMLYLQASTPCAPIYLLLLRRRILEV